MCCYKMIIQQRNWISFHRALSFISYALSHHRPLQIKKNKTVSSSGQDTQVFIQGMYFITVYLR